MCLPSLSRLAEQSLLRVQYSVPPNLFRCEKYIALNINKHTHCVCARARVCVRACMRTGVCLYVCGVYVCMCIYTYI